MSVVLSTDRLCLRELTAGDEVPRWIEKNVAKAAYRMVY